MAAMVDFSYFWSTSQMMLPTKFQVNWLFSSGEEENKSCQKTTQLAWKGWSDKKTIFKY